jgi:hypothetical protein
MRAIPLPRESFGQGDGVGSVLALDELVTEQQHPRGFAQGVDRHPPHSHRRHAAPVRGVEVHVAARLNYQPRATVVHERRAVREVEGAHGVAEVVVPRRPVDEAPSGGRAKPATGTSGRRSRPVLDAARHASCCSRRRARSWRRTQSAGLRGGLDADIVAGGIACRPRRVRAQRRTQHPASRAVAAVVTGRAQVDIGAAS